jgi:DNA-binding CsgD family transcriptional regulator
MVTIVDEIYDALTDDEAFAALPARVQALVPGTRYCMMFSVEDAGNIGFLVNTPRYTRAEADAFMRSDAEAKRNPFLEPILTGGLSNRALTSASFLSPSEFERTQYYDEVIRPFGDATTHFLFAKLDFRGGYSVLSLQRGRHEEPFSEAEVAAVQPYVTHLRRTLGMRAMLTMRDRSAAEALSLTSQAVLVTDPCGRLVMGNRQGEALLEPEGPLALRSGCVRARLPAADVRLQHLLDAAGRGVGGHGGAMLLQVDETRSLRVVVTPWRQGAGRQVVLLIDDPERRDLTTAKLLAGLYRFTAAEAGTVAALTEGLSPAEVAETRGVSLATIRTQIHHALRKSEARSLADLVRLAASLPKLRPPAG